MALMAMVFVAPQLGPYGWTIIFPILLVLKFALTVANTLEGRDINDRR